MDDGSSSAWSASALALLLSRLNIHSLLDLTIEMAGLLGGGFAGAYTLGMFTRRANSAACPSALRTAIVVTMAAWWNDLVHPYFYLGISIVAASSWATSPACSSRRRRARCGPDDLQRPCAASLRGARPIDTQFLKTFLTVADEDRWRRRRAS
jgi:hypothetical protein